MTESNPAPRQRIDPHLFKPDYVKVQIHKTHPKHYVAALSTHGVKYPLKSSKHYQTAAQAQAYALRVWAKWYHLYLVSIKSERAVVSEA